GGAIFAWRLDVELLDGAVVDDHRIALRTLAETELASVHGQSNRLGEVAVAVGDHGDIAASVALAPGGHDERVIDRNAGDFVDALVLQLLGLVDVGWQVPRRAGRGERARHREQRNALALEE